MMTPFLAFFVFVIKLNETEQGGVNDFVYNSWNLSFVFVAMREMSPMDDFGAIKTLGKCISAIFEYQIWRARVKNIFSIA